jgi:hypothetical protein
VLAQCERTLVAMQRTPPQGSGVTDHVRTPKEFASLLDQVFCQGRWVATNRRDEQEGINSLQREESRLLERRVAG